MDLAECSLPWLDGIAKDVPYNYLTVRWRCGTALFAHRRLGSFESKPEFTAEHLVGVGLYTSDALSESFMPISMGSREELTSAFLSLNEVLKDATNKLWCGSPVGRATR